MGCLCFKFIGIIEVCQDPRILKYFVVTPLDWWRYRSNETFSQVGWELVVFEVKGK